MGNSSNKSYHRPRRKYGSQHSIGDIIGASCKGGRAEGIDEGDYRPRSIFSRSSWSVGTNLSDNFGRSKTAWPVAQSESMFLPQFKVNQDPLESRYKLLELIATGAYGRVYKVQSRRTNEIYALKIMSKAKIIEEDAVGQVKEEVSIERVVGHHPFVADTLGHWQEKKNLYIIMDYFGGGELLSLIEDCGPLPEELVRIHIGELALAIDFLHNAGIVHRDIKPSNVLLDDEGHAILIDFGLAKWLSSHQRTRTICGTLEYMAPEILREECYGNEVDWWSLGVLACYALTKQFPQEERSPLIVDQKSNRQREQDEAGEAISKTADPPILVVPNNGGRAVSKAAEDLLQRLLQPDPRLRLKSVLSLQRIAFYMGHEIRTYISKKISPLSFIDRQSKRRAIATTTTDTPHASNKSDLHFPEFDYLDAVSTGKEEFVDHLSNVDPTTERGRGRRRKFKSNSSTSRCSPEQRRKSRIQNSGRSVCKGIRNRIYV